MTNKGMERIKGCDWRWFGVSRGRGGSGKSGFTITAGSDTSIGNSRVSGS